MGDGDGVFFAEVRDKTRKTANFHVFAGGQVEVGGGVHGGWKTIEGGKGPVDDIGADGDALGCGDGDNLFHHVGGEAAQVRVGVDLANRASGQRCQSGIGRKEDKFFPKDAGDVVADFHREASAAAGLCEGLKGGGTCAVKGAEDEAVGAVSGLDDAGGLDGGAVVGSAADDVAAAYDIGDASRAVDTVHK